MPAIPSRLSRPVRRSPARYLGLAPIGLALVLAAFGCAQPPPVPPQPPPKPVAKAKPPPPTAAQKAALRQDADRACSAEAEQATADQPDPLLAASTQQHLHELCMAQRGFVP